MMFENKTVKDDNKILVYPNPAKDEVFIALNDLQTTTIQISITDANGKILYSKSNQQVLDGLTSLELDLGNGLYFVKIIKTQSNEIFIQKLVIQK